MTDVEKVRVVVAHEPGQPYAQIVCGFPESTWEIISPEEWDALKRKLCEEWLGADWTIYDYAEAVLHVPMDALRGLFAPPIAVAKVEIPDA